MKTCPYPRPQAIIFLIALSYKQIFLKCLLALCPHLCFVVTGFCHDAHILQQLLCALSSNRFWAPAAPEPAGERLSRTRSDAPERSWAVPDPAGFPARRRRIPVPRSRFLPRGQSEREGGRNARPVPRRRQAVVPNLGPSLAAAFAISVSRNRKVPVQLAPHKILSPSSRSPPSAPSCLWPVPEEPLLSLRDGAEALGAPPRRQGMGTGLWGPSAWAQTPARSQRPGAPRAGLP